MSAMYIEDLEFLVEVDEAHGNGESCSKSIIRQAKGYSNDFKVKEESQQGTGKGKRKRDGNEEDGQADHDKDAQRNKIAAGKIMKLKQTGLKVLEVSDGVLVSNDSTEAYDPLIRLLLERRASFKVVASRPQCRPRDHFRRAWKLEGSRAGEP
ncbi:hypothetical protein BGW39_001694 [Mortierella sp. 14UC]|nr:hypothetical protein BGW39_001694 [Mortierella sp. 14UC]